MLWQLLHTLRGSSRYHGPSFNLTAQASLYYPAGRYRQFTRGVMAARPHHSAFAPLSKERCPTMQVPGPTLIVTEGETVTVKLTNDLPTAAGNTSILFPGFNVTTSGGRLGPADAEAAPGDSDLHVHCHTPGTRAYYSGTQGDLQVEMGLYGASLYSRKTARAHCLRSRSAWQQHAAEAPMAKLISGFPRGVRHPPTCYDREYLFQFSEMDRDIHTQALAQVTAAGKLHTGPGCSLNVPTEPYHPTYFMVNGRSMPDDMDPNYAPQYPHQPYNGNPHMHPGEQVLLRVIGQGRWQHPFHEHGNHVRILARDGNLILEPDDPRVSPGRCCSPPQPLRDWQWTESSTGRAGSELGYLRPQQPDPRIRCQAHLYSGRERL